jgi:hypothetical protein
VTGDKAKQLENKWKQILALDLTTVKANFMRRKSRWQRFWWKRKFNIDAVEYEYKKFLYLVCTNPDKCIVPWNDELDNLWHEHILDTRKYAADCNLIYGKIIHHNPNLPQGTPAHTNHWQETKRLLKTSFNYGKKS